MKSLLTSRVKKIKYFIDFDDTLFDRGRFTDDLFGIIKNFGFSNQEILSSYQAVYNHGYDGIWAHLAYLDKHVRKFDVRSVRGLIKELLEKSEIYLYPESTEFLKSIDKDKYAVQLLTVGNIKFQKMKVKNSRIENLFDKCNYTTLPKAKALRSLVKLDEVFILLDDKEKELLLVSSVFKNAHVIRAEGGKLIMNGDPIKQVL